MRRAPLSVLSLLGLGGLTAALNAFDRDRGVMTASLATGGKFSGAINYGHSDKRPILRGRAVPYGRTRAGKTPRRHFTCRMTGSQRARIRSKRAAR